jgi:divalent metal cation (Fe/Co/Zn/Cd) transporter
MNKQKLATLLLSIVSFVIIAFGILYIYTGFTKGLMPYHVKYIGCTCQELPATVCELMKTFVQIIGFAFLAIGVTMYSLVRNMFNHQQDDLDWKMIAVMVAVLIPIVPIMYHLATYTPWYVVAGILLLSIVALVLVKPNSPTLASKHF